MMAYKHAIVVGASSGIGAELAKQLLESGCRVALVARRRDKLEAIAATFPDAAVVAEHDVHDTAAVPALFQDLCKQLGGLDLVVYASGVMPPVGMHEYDTAKDLEMVAVNLNGAIAWLNEAAVRFEGVKAGTIVGIGSVAGDRGRSGQPVYNTTKAALATYLEALRNRLAKLGVTVVTIKPGPTQSEMTAHMPQAKMMPADEAARRILAKSRRTGEHYLSPAHAVIFFVIRHVPSWLFRRTKI